MEHLDDILKEFLVESYESLDQLDQDLMSLEEQPEDRDRLASIFRTIHTIKGTSGFLSFPKLEHVTHVGESLLVPLRDGEMKFTNEIASGLLSMLDAVRKILAHIETGDGEGDQDYSEVIQLLETLRTGEPIQDSPPKAPEPDEAPKPKATGRKRSTTPRKRGKRSQPEASADDGPQEISQDTPETPQPADEPVVEPAVESPTNLDSAAENGSVLSRSEAHERNSTIADTTVRLDVELLDRLMNLVGELVLARNQIIQFSRTSEDTTMAAASQRLNLITTELQEGVMKTRMQPIRNAWSKLPRVVRDLSNAFGKRVNVRMDGADTELDKTILEAIKDPLTHIVRNAVDHGIETPDIRAAAGKPKEGTLWLRAFHEGGQVNVEIRDDGAGINFGRVKEKAIARGLVTEDQVSAMSERELTNLILLPGFSTAQKVTNVSGRGVGMDVVKTNVEKIGGTLDIHSVPGRGTTLRVKIPLTLAIVPALVITCEGDRYAIPQVSLLELVRLDGDRAPLEIELVHNEPAYRLRGRLLPLLYLDEELGLRGKRLPQEHGKASSVNIVVLQAEDRQFGLVVDQINDTQEIVVKPLGKQIKSISTYAGATIMGDGAVSLILDVNGLAARGRVLTKHRDHPLANASLNASETMRASSSWLLVDPGDGSQVAVPLTAVDRLEEFSASQLELAAHQHVVQYRNAIMPLIPLSGGYIDASSDNPLHVIVHSTGARRVGIVVGRILDVVDDIANLDGTNPSELGEARVIAGRVTSLADIPSLVRNVLPVVPELEFA